MRPRLCICVWLLTTTGCRFSEPVVRDAFIACASDDECPSDLICNVPNARCVDAAADVRAPLLSGYAFEAPVTASGSTDLIVQADEGLADDGATVDAHPALLEALTASGAEGNVYRFRVDVDRLPEGSWPVAAVTVRDLAGNAASLRQPNVALLVDRTAPWLTAIERSDEPVDGYSDVAGLRDRNGALTSQLSLRFVASEPLREVTLEVGTANAPCTVLETLRPRWECVVDLAEAAVADGVNSARLTVTDLAGNASIRLDDVVVDAAAPSLVAGSVLLDLAGPGTTGVTDSAVEGGRLRVRFLADEPVATARVFLVPGGDAFDVDVDETSVNAQLTLPTDLRRTTLALHAELVDRFGHVRGVDVPLPAPYEDGIPVVPSVATPCPHPGTSCVDVDGDGAFAIVGCATGTDCNDLDPTVFPGAIELPGDGVANDCSSRGDMPIDEASGVFIDADSGDDATGDGSRAAPVRSVRGAVSLAREPARRFFYVAASASELNAFDLGEEPGGVDGIVGGLDPAAGWSRRPGASSAFSFARDFDLDDNGFLDGVSFHQISVHTRDAFVVRSRFSFDGQLVPILELAGDAVVFRCDIDVKLTLAEGATATLVENHLGGWNARFAARSHATVVRSTVEYQRPTAGDDLPWMRCESCDLTVVSSFIASAPPFEMTAGSHVVLEHSNVIDDFDVPAGAAFRAFGSLFELDDSRPFFRIAVAPETVDVHLRGNGFLRRLAPLATAFVGRGTESLSPEAFAALPGVVSVDNRAIDAVPFEASFCVAATSVARDADVGPFPDASAVGVLDRFGDCRYSDGRADIGADELTVGSACVPPDR